MPAGSALPGLIVNGTLPTVTTVLLQAGDGHRVADLETGTIGPSLPGDGTTLARPGGGWVCVCSAYTPDQGGSGSDGLVIALQAIAPDGSAAGAAPVRTLLSRIDPSQPLTSDSTGVNLQASSSPDGRYGFIGWSERSTTGWHAGVDVVDLATLEVVDRQALPDPVLPDAAKGRTWVLLAPFVDMAASSGPVLVTENWFVDDAAAANPPQGTFHLSATFRDGLLGDPVPAGTRVDAGCFEWEHGVIDEGSFYVACIRNDSGGVRVERFRMDGTAIDQADVGQFTGYGAFAARPDHRLFLWDPQSHTLMRYDLQTGSTSRLAVPDTAGTQGPLDAASMVGRTIGSWIAPTATAKIYLQPAMVVSPDGTRLYAIGIEATPAELGGSAGVFAFDISGDEIALVGHWPPNADYISLALSADGGFVYAAGMSGVDPQGVMAPDVQSSITVFDASDGSIRLVAGELGAGELGAQTSILFTSPLIQ
jgi:hypothetical protein